MSNIFDGDFELATLVLLEMLSFQRKLERSDVDNESIYKYDENKVGTLNGYLMEPMNPSYGISNKYFF